MRGTGSCCGAAFLNIRFEEYVRKKLGSESFRVIRERQPRSWLTALNHFEQVWYNVTQSDASWIVVTLQLDVSGTC